jgi:hypothetical protein
MPGDLTVSADSDAQQPTSGAERQDPLATSGWLSRWCTRPWVVAAILAIVCLPLRSTVPQAGLDPSWQLGLSLVHVNGVSAGPGFVFTYGPLGFLTQPNIVWLPGALLGLGYAFAAVFALYFMVCRSLGEWLPPITAVALTVVFALVTAGFGNAGANTTAELATAALILWALTLVRPSVLTTALPGWVPLVLGVAVALQLLVKFSAGSVSLAVALIVACARPPRLKNILLSGAAFLAAVLTLWLGAQQSLGDLAEWLEKSVQIAVGYTPAMAYRAGFSGTRYWVLWIIPAAFLVFALWRLIRECHLRALPLVALVALAVWFFTKAGFVRLDSAHANIAYLGFGALIIAIPWERRWLQVGLVGLAIALGAVVVSSGFSMVPLRSLATRPEHGVSEATTIVRSTLQPSYRSSKLDAARRSIQKAARVPNSVVSALDGAEVHADPTEIAALWAYGLSWRPVPVFQNYAAYTVSLDDANADSLLSPAGPTAVLREPGANYLGRVPAWESPSYMVALTCSYRLIDAARGWQALTRTTDACGRSDEISRAVAPSGATIRVPAPKNAGDLIVATFDYPTAPLERLATTILKPLHDPIVMTNGHQHAFVVGTAGDSHLLHVPERVGARRVTNAGLDIRRLSFPNAPSVVTVNFFEISTG